MPQFVQIPLQGYEKNKSRPCGGRLSGCAFRQELAASSGVVVCGYLLRCRDVPNACTGSLVRVTRLRLLP